MELQPERELRRAQELERIVQNLTDQLVVERSLISKRDKELVELRSQVQGLSSLIQNLKSEFFSMGEKVFKIDLPTSTKTTILSFKELSINSNTKEIYFFETGTRKTLSEKQCRFLTRLCADRAQGKELSDVSDFKVVSSFIYSLKREIPELKNLFIGKPKTGISLDISQVLN